jgi:diaminopimelate epimerase
MKFSRYHALGNDYLVMDAQDFELALTEARVKRICHRHFGVGSDGILLRESSRDPETFHLRIYNPDGSEAEKSGNGLRIFARYLWDIKAVADKPFVVKTAGGMVTCHVQAEGSFVAVDMGRVSFSSAAIPVTGVVREVIRESIEVGDRDFTFCAATIGNPHCVILDGEVSAEEARRYGPLLERHPYFPNRTNVQFLEVLDRSSIRIEIWERGAGYTLASGSSSSAAAAVARRLGLVGDEITVHMPGGAIEIEISPNYDIRMKGPVTRIADGQVYEEIFDFRATQSRE